MDIIKENELSTLYKFEYKGNHNIKPQYAIKDFYDDSVIFITGGTGFVGKVLIEKLLRSFKNIKQIYILIRTKRGQSSDIRFKEFLKDQVFNRIRKECPEVLNKLISISGDVTEPYLGLNDIDRQKLIENVTIVFNSAATVKFNEPLMNAINMNTFGTERTMTLCSKMMKLKSVCHVSTAYSNPGAEVYEEKIYPLEVLDKDSFMKCVKDLPPDFVNSIIDKVKGSHENTYTLSKSIAEGIISEYSQKFPVSIVRPSIVTASIEDPVPGFVDNIQAVNGLFLAIGRGYTRIVLGDENCVMDLIPVDVVARKMICAAWRTGTEIKQNVEIYNCVSGKTNPMTLQKAGEYLTKWSRKHPSEHVMMYPMIFFLTNSLLFKSVGFLLNILPAMIFDLFLTLMGSKPLLTKFSTKCQGMVEVVKFVNMRTWQFGDENTKELGNFMKNAVDKAEFNHDISNMNWDSYMENLVLGLRKYVLREDDSSLPKARKKLLMLLLVQITLPIVLIIVLTRFFFGF